jgi:hypothetical protein
MRGTRAAGSLALALVVATAISGSGLAEAKQGQKGKKKLGPVVTRSSTASGSGHMTVISARTRCPRRTRVVGGGFAIDPSPGLPVAGFIYESRKVGQRAWRASAQVSDIFGPAEVVTLDAYAYCRRNAPKLSTKTSAVPTPAAMLLGPSAKAKCPKRRRVVAGGFLTAPPISPGGSRNVITDSLAAGRRAWWSRVASLGGAGSLTSYAYCARRKKSLRSVTSSTTQAEGPIGALATSTASCPGSGEGTIVLGSGRNSTSGGFSQQPPGLGPPPLLFVYVSARVDQGWTLSAARSTSLATPLVLNSTVYCG